MLEEHLLGWDGWARQVHRGKPGRGEKCYQGKWRVPELVTGSVWPARLKENKKKWCLPALPLPEKVPTHLCPSSTHPKINQ